MEEENLIPENEKYIKRWGKLILENRKRGRDCEVLYEFLNVRDSILESKPDFIIYLRKKSFQRVGIYDYLKRNDELYNKVFEELERKIRED